MTLESAIFLNTFSFSHVFFPGHPTPLLLTTGGMGMKKAWQFTLGGAIGMQGLGHMITATSIVFFRTAFGFCTVTAVASFTPKLVKSPKLGPAICLVTALVCFANVTYRTWNTWA